MLFSSITHGDGDELSSIRLRVLSLGAGVQSTTMALVAAHGEIGPMPDCAIFADTGWEPKAVYDHLEWLMSPNVLPFPVHIVSAGNFRDNLMRAAAGERWASIPAFAKTVTLIGTPVPVFDTDEDGGLIPIGMRSTSRETVSIGMIRRACTTDFKIVPIRRKVRDLLDLTRKRSPDYPVAEQWIGISKDEAVRMKPSVEDWQVNRSPLIERRMSRQDCLAWLRRHDYPLPPNPLALAAPITTTSAGVISASMIPKAGPMWSRLITPCAVACVAFEVRFTSIVPACRWRKPTCPRPPIVASSTSGRTNAKACAAYDENIIMQSLFRPNVLNGSLFLLGPCQTFRLF